ncbi:hypothetical protein JOB18_048503, partial [Solea senegalensis]
VTVVVTVAVRHSHGEVGDKSISRNVEVKGGVSGNAETVQHDAVNSREGVTRDDGGSDGQFLDASQCFRMKQLWFRLPLLPSFDFP